jgi:hypothetical protein
MSTVLCRVACIGSLSEDTPLLAEEIGRAAASLDPPAQLQALLETLDAFHVSILVTGAVVNNGVLGLQC